MFKKSMLLACTFAASSISAAFNAASNAPINSPLFPPCSKASHLQKRDISPLSESFRLEERSPLTPLDQFTSPIHPGLEELGLRAPTNSPEPKHTDLNNDELQTQLITLKVGRQERLLATESNKRSFIAKRHRELLEQITAARAEAFKKIAPKIHWER